MGALASSSSSPAMSVVNAITPSGTWVDEFDLLCGQTGPSLLNTVTHRRAFLHGFKCSGHLPWVSVIQLELFLQGQKVTTGLPLVARRLNHRALPTHTPSSACFCHPERQNGRFCFATLGINGFYFFKVVCVPGGLFQRHRVRRWVNT